MRHFSKKSDSSLRIALLFALCILLLIAGGVLLKLFLVLRASTFDGVHQYIVEIDDNHQKGMLIAFNPGTKSVNILSITGKVDSTFGKYLGVPDDATITMPIPKDPAKVVTDMLFKNEDEKNITLIDKLRLLLFVNALKSNDFHTTFMTLPISTGAETVLSNLFLDNTLYFDNESIAIVNATGKGGIASSVAHELGIIGMNVVAATTATTNSDTTQLTATDTNTYTVMRIERLFHVTAQRMASGGISNIVLTIGKNSLSELQ